MSRNIEKMQEFWRDYADAFAHPLTSNGILGKFVNNRPVTGSYAEAWIRSLAKSMLREFRISTGTIIASSDRMRYQKNHQCDLIIWDPTELPAIFEQGEFAVVPIHSARGIIEVKRSTTAISTFEQQLKERQKMLFHEYRKHVMGIVVSHPQPLFQYSVTPDWLEHLPEEEQPAITRLLKKGGKQPDPDGVFAFIYYLSQISRLSRA